MNFDSNKMIKRAVIGVGGVLAALLIGNSALTYNEAGHQTHIRTITGSESVVSETGWAWKGFGKATQWKMMQTVQFTVGEQRPVDGAENVVNFRATFQGNVDAAVEASTRFRMPQGEQFLKIAREYRTPENFYATAVIPAVKETLQTTASMMSADEYFAGGRSDFSVNFEDQLRNGMYHTRRVEQQVVTARTNNDSENTTSGREGSEVKRSTFAMVKLADKDGNLLRKAQTFRGFGVEVVEARIASVEPNPKFRESMQLVQESQAKRIKATQDRMREEEEKQLAIARGERIVEEQRQATMKEQVQKTVEAETTKGLALIEAAKLKEQALVTKETAAIELETAKLKAQTTRTQADAEAHAKKVVLEANGALEQKLEALVAMNKAMADAIRVAPVPTTVIGGDGGSGRADEVGNLLKMMTVNQAKALALDMSIKK